MREYPSEHNKIVSELLDGKFIISPSPLFYTIQELEDDYTEFFIKSFNYKLNLEAEFIYLSSDEVNEKRTRDFTLFLAMLSRELDYSGTNFRDKIELGSFDINETEELLRQSSKWEILEKTTVSEFDKFIKTWRSKNLIEIDANKFKFTKAVKLFFTFAVEIAEEKLKEKTNEEKANA
jgi:hypothetical protein